MFTINWTLNHEVEVKSDFDTAKEKIAIILKKREYKDIKLFHNMISFDNGFFDRKLFGTTTAKVPKGAFNFNNDHDTVTLKFMYKIAYLDILCALIVSICFGYFITNKFYYFSAFGACSWILITFC